MRFVTSLEALPTVQNTPEKSTEEEYIHKWSDFNTGCKYYNTVSEKTIHRGKIFKTHPTKEPLRICVSDFDFYEKDKKNAKNTGIRIPHFNTLVKKPVVRIYGVTEKGNNVTVHAHGFLPYLYVEKPANMKVEELTSFLSNFNTTMYEHSRHKQGFNYPQRVNLLKRKRDEEEPYAPPKRTKFRHYENDFSDDEEDGEDNSDGEEEEEDYEMQTPEKDNEESDDEENKNNQNDEQDTTIFEAKLLSALHCINVSPNAYVVSAEIVERFSTEGYQFEKKKEMIKLSFSSPYTVNAAMIFLKNKGVQTDCSNYRFQKLYDANVPLGLRFIYDKGTGGGHWIELPASTYAYRETENEKESRSQLECDILADDIQSLPNEKEWIKIPRQVELAFDIEVKNMKYKTDPNKFPKAEEDPIIQISVMVKNMDQGIEDSYSAILTTKHTSAIPNTDIFVFESEAELLRNFFLLVHKCSPDRLLTYNGTLFDIPYIFDRCQILNVRDDYIDLGNWKTGKTIINKDKIAGNQQQGGKRKSTEIRIVNRINQDMFIVILKSYKLKSYTLNYVSEFLLKQKKEDVPHHKIGYLFDGSDDDRKKLAVYCLKDSKLCLLLSKKLDCVIKDTEQCRVNRSPIHFLYTRGSSILVINHLRYEAAKRYYVIPFKEPQEKTEKYKGAVVIEPEVGFYEDPICVFDFESLYPNIMRAYNLCLTTLLTRAQAEALHPDEYIVAPFENGTFSYFIKPKEITEITPEGIEIKKIIRVGLFPLMLTDLLNARKSVKAMMKHEKDPFKYSILDGRQWALKIQANSCYGVLGSPYSPIYCLPIPVAVTGFGREMILKSKHFIETKFTVQNGYKYNAKVIYGDTDSVMIKFGDKIEDLAYLFNLCPETVKEITELFPRPINLAFDKIFLKMFLKGKKRYAGTKVTSLGGEPEVDVKGMETVRRDSCIFTQETQQKCLDLLLAEGVEAAKQHAKNCVQQLLLAQVPIYSLLLSKRMSDDPTSPTFNIKLPHTGLVHRQLEKNGFTPYRCGDRVKYIVVTGAKKANVFDKTEDPLEVMEKNLPIDYSWYLSNQFTLPIMGIFEPILKDKAKEIFHGPHTQKKVSTATNPNQGIFSFMKKTSQCQHCKIALPSKVFGLCSNCKPNKPLIKDRVSQQLSKCSKDLEDLWSYCINKCQNGDKETAESCKNADCDKIYQRIQLKKDVARVSIQLDEVNLA